MFKYYKKGSDRLSIASEESSGNAISINSGSGIGSYTDFQFEITDLSIASDNTETVINLVSDTNIDGVFLQVFTPASAISHGLLKITLGTAIPTITATYVTAVDIIPFDTVFNLKIIKSGTTLQFLMNDTIITEWTTTLASYSANPTEIMTYFKGSFKTTAFSDYPQRMDFTDSRLVADSNILNAETDFEIEATFKTPSTITTDEAIFSGSGGTSSSLYGILRYSSTYLALSLSNGLGSANAYSTNYTFSTDTEYTIKVKKIGTLISYDINGTTDTDTTTVLHNMTIIQLGTYRTFSAFNFNGSIYNAKIWSGGDRNTGTLETDLINDHYTVIDLTGNYTYTEFNDTALNPSAAITYYGNIFNISTSSSGIFTDITGAYTPSTSYTHWTYTDFTIDISDYIYNKPKISKSIQGLRQYFFNSESSVEFIIPESYTFTNNNEIAIYRNNDAMLYPEDEMIFYGRIKTLTERRNRKQKVYSITAEPMTTIFKTDYTINESLYTLDELLDAVRDSLGTDWSIITPFTPVNGVPLLNEEYLMTSSYSDDPNNASSQLRKVSGNLECFGMGTNYLTADNTFLYEIFYHYLPDLTYYTSACRGKEAPVPASILDRYKTFRSTIRSFSAGYPTLAQVTSPDYVSTGNSGYLKYDQKIFVYGKSTKQYGFKPEEVGIYTLTATQWVNFDTLYLVSGEEDPHYNWYFYADDATDKIYAVNRYIPIEPDTLLYYGQNIEPTNNLNDDLQSQINIAAILSDIAKLTNTKIRITENKITFIDMATEAATAFTGTLLEHVETHETYDTEAFNLNLNVNAEQSTDLNIEEAEKYYKKYLGLNNANITMNDLIFYDLTVIPKLGERFEYDGIEYGIVTNLQFDESAPKLITMTCNGDY